MLAHRWHTHLVPLPSEKLQIFSFGSDKETLVIFDCKSMFRNFNYNFRAKCVCCCHATQLPGAVSTCVNGRHSSRNFISTCLFSTFQFLSNYCNFLSSCLCNIRYNLTIFVWLQNYQLRACCSVNIYLQRDNFSFIKSVQIYKSFGHRRIMLPCVLRNKERSFNTQPMCFNATWHSGNRPWSSKSANMSFALDIIVSQSVHDSSFFNFLILR